MNVDDIVDIILESNNIVFFGGAGVSTESGIPDFRSSTGLYNRKHETGYSPEYMLSHDFLVEDVVGFTKYYKENLIVEDAKPNITHKVLAKLEKMGKVKAVVTQNIDSLHHMAGSKNVYEIHGNLRDYYCVKCGKTYDADYVLQTVEPNYCDCGGYIRPDVTLYGEGLPEEAVRNAINAIAHADVLIIGGTSLVVYPAASFIDFYRGNKCILINKEQVGRNTSANYVIMSSLGEVFRKIDEKIK
ncbi:NAD-dependent protein deacylase [Helcococcus kunzii]|uniref:NAD-dependent protein deacylase n=1 Tax=Helcococcus kunzii TaxID=40091 RepID=UPI0024ACB58B|nr:NAD-dependent protein deacylase [Helcococcus kunzii]